MNEHPTSFQIEKSAGECSVSYQNLMEICQGGPEVGEMSINGSPIKGCRFGGPFIINGEMIYAPLFKRKFLKSGFVLARINLKTQAVEELSKLLPLIYLSRVEGDQICYFTDLNGQNEVSL